MNLSLQETKLIHQIISVVSARGAIKAEELTIVGTFFDKVTKFLQSKNKEIEEKELEKEKAPREKAKITQDDSDDESSKEERRKKKKSASNGNTQSDKISGIPEE